MTIIEQRIPRLNTDFDFPRDDDDRWIPLGQQLVANGMMDEHGNTIRPLHMMKFCTETEWIYTVVVYDDAEVKTQ